MDKNNSEEIKETDNSADVAQTPVNDTKVSAQYQAFNPCYFTYEGVDYHLHQGETYSLPDCDFVRSLIGQGILK